jgi:NAD(P)H-hydrate epimerase
LRLETRGLDAEAAEKLGIPTLVLMENAGRGAAVWFTEQAAGFLPDMATRPFGGGPLGLNASATRSLPHVLILCGSGNNGGDGGVVARHLDAWGFPVKVVWFAHRADLRGDAQTQFAILEKSQVDQVAWLDACGDDQPAFALESLIAASDWLIDGLLGTGLTRPVEGMLATVVKAVNHSGKPVLALDLPSGLDADRGVPLGVAVRARTTATFVALKLGFGAPGASEYTGTVAVIDIGVPRKLLKRFEQE